MKTVPQSLISPSNPLKDFPYWDSPDGKNLNAIAFLEWLDAYLGIMQNELPCNENSETMWHVKKALKIQLNRIARRKAQGVLGTCKPHKLTSIDGVTEIA